jgi:ribosome-binding ATPase YchF (GTP1/OBG family)
LSEDQLKATRSFQLLSQKRRLAIINLADDETDFEKYKALDSANRPIIAVPVGLELELARMTPAEQDDFRQEMGIGGFDRDALIRTIMTQSGQMLFFTAGEKEVRTWLIPQGSTAVEAADTIHSDLARGFIRAETMTCDDLIRLGSEREVKAQHLVRQEPKDYVIQDGDVLNVRFSV